MKFIFYILLFVGSVFAYSEKTVAIKGVMKVKKTAAFHLNWFRNIEDCYVSIDRGNLEDTLDSFIEANWDAGEVLKIAVPASAVTVDECDEEELRANDFVPVVSQRFSGVSNEINGGSSSSSPDYECDSPEYRALEARVEDYNSESQDGSSMNLPSCTGGGSSIPDCDSEEYQEAEREAQRNGDPIGPCRGRAEDRGSRGVR